MLVTLETTSSFGETDVSFAGDVRPILARNCLRCHGPDDAEAGLSFSQPETVMEPLVSGGTAVVPGDPSSSALLARVTSQDPDLRMPPEGKPLTSEEIGTLRAWIEQGADWQAHWAYQPVVASSLPVVQGSFPHPVDRFLQARLEARNLSLAPRASRRVLIRRLTYGLTGLPPSPEEVTAFENDSRPDAYERLVDRLLASPHYGERWGRHWLDLVRYAESDSYERDNPKPMVWRYRDYVIRSFNEDKRYDQFVMEQIAGDELADASVDAVIATGYQRLGLWDDEPVDARQAYFDNLDDVVSTTGQVFLGTTFGCARCHDHKIDPIPQRDYYRLVSFFRNTLENIIPGEFKDRPFTLNTTVVVATAEQRQEHEDRRAEIASKLEPLEQELAKLEQLVTDTFSNPEREDAADARQRQAMIEKRASTILTSEQEQRWRTLQTEIKELRNREIPPLPRALAIRENGRECPDTYVLLRGSVHSPGDRVEPGFPEILGGGEAIIPPLPEHIPSSGRRKVLAEWIASPENPLTSRVIVNRIWQHHFGRGIVATPNDFGLMGTPPTHPDLLDWLADWLVRHDWSLKSLHRLLLTSHAYRMTASPSSEASLGDPDNKLFSRQNMRRLEAEEIRDSLLAVGGVLNRKMYGPSIYTKIPAEVLAGQSRPGHNWGKSSESERRRRSIYIHVKRSLIPPELSLFDSAETDMSCPVRFTSTQPTQALAMLNSEASVEHAKHLRIRVTTEVGDRLADQVERVLTLVTQRPALQEEIDRGLALIDAWNRDHQLSNVESLQLFCQLAINLNEFLFLD